MHRIREVIDKPNKHVVQTHYHDVRMLDASTYNAAHIYTSHNIFNLIMARALRLPLGDF
ncbi:hypothetical protein ACT3S8_16720 [Halomonas sp. AOP42-D2-25]|uniref:hypothetical protein n=1 Tax=Halomonas sp. AOP42-D2-25 TaxID=3457666 RepID=UPI004033F8FB